MCIAYRFERSIMDNAYQRIAEKLPLLSKNQKKIANYLLANENDAPFLTVSKLAAKVCVSDATVIRFANALGYSGYLELQQSIQDSVQRQLTTVARLRSSLENPQSIQPNNIFQNDIANIEITHMHLDESAIQEAAHAIIAAKNVYILASRSAKALGVFLEYYLDIIRDNIHILDYPWLKSSFLETIGPDDVVIGISFSRYSSSTVETFDFAKEKKAFNIAITDRLTSPLTRSASVSLLAESKIPSFIDSFVAPLSLINYLIFCISSFTGDSLYKRMNNLEKTWEKLNAFTILE